MFNYLLYCSITERHGFLYLWKINRIEKERKARTYIIWAARLLILLCFVLVTLFVGQHLPGRNNIQLSSGTLDSSGEYYNNNKNPGDSSMEEEKTYSTNAPLIKVNTDPSSYTVLVNRDYPMPEDYVPEDLVIPDVDYSYNGIYEKSYMREAAAKALEKMFCSSKEKKEIPVKSSFCLPFIRKAECNLPEQYKYTW